MRGERGPEFQQRLGMQDALRCKHVASSALVEQKTAGGYVVGVSVGWEGDLRSSGLRSVLASARVPEESAQSSWRWSVLLCRHRGVCESNAMDSKAGCGRMYGPIDFGGRGGVVTKRIPRSSSHERTA